MKPYQRKLTVELLRMASDEFAHHGCNDFDLDEHGLTKEEQIDFAMEAAHQNGESAEETGDRLLAPRYSVQDWEAMAVLAKLLENEP